jgi:murein DD-endopeptidase MepM/ murein hydrolase activator NlpD
VKKSSTLKTALVVVGGSLVAAPVAAVELGPIKVHSTLGQPLRASIQYALGPNEALTDTCVTIPRNIDSHGLPALNGTSLIVADGVIAITGSAIVREPLMTMRINVNCPYTAQLTREYMMFIDPAATNSTPIEAPVAARVASQPQLAPQRAARAAVATRRPANAAPIAANRYQVEPGDSLSRIAQRIENRRVALWPAVNAIFDANPDAFLDNDPNKLKAGSWLTIPNLGSDAPASVAAASTPAAITEPAPATIATTAQSMPYEPPAAAPTADDATPVSTTSALADLKPGDVIIDADNPFVAPVSSGGGETIVIPDTILDAPATTSSSPNVPVATIQRSNPAEPGKTQWLLWLGGGGIALFFGLLLFGRRFREGFASAPIAPAVPQRRRSDGDTQRLETIGEPDMDIMDSPLTSEGLALDADLIMGTGLQDGADVDDAQDFGFAATTALDIELPEEMSSGGPTSETDIIPPFKIDESSILESEILPTEEDEYDMSVIVDATKMPHPDDVTERDLEAIQIDSDDGTLITGDYTVSQEVDYKILEQDYEDEMTATQALNLEIQKAAEDLAVRMDDQDSADETTEMPLATVHELDVTAQMQARNNQDIDDDDDTGINPTVNMDTDSDTVEMRDDNTVEMPKGGKKTG